jgi:formiminoglutamase
LRECPFEINKQTLLIISIDSDGFDSSFMSAVSAVNIDGINLDHYLELQSKLKKLSTGQKCLGIYEYNPIYEDLSLKGARALTKVITEFLK